MIKQKQDIKLRHMNVKIRTGLIIEAKKCALDLGIDLKEYVTQALEEKIEVNTGNYRK